MHTHMYMPAHTHMHTLRVLMHIHACLHTYTHRCRWVGGREEGEIREGDRRRMDG